MPAAPHAGRSIELDFGVRTPPYMDVTKSVGPATRPTRAGSREACRGSTSHIFLGAIFDYRTPSPFAPKRCLSKFFINIENGRLFRRDSGGNLPLQRHCGHRTHPALAVAFRHRVGMICNANIARARLPGHRNGRAPSKITIPQRANPFARLVFSEMKRQNISYHELEHLSGVLVCTIKAWRAENRPGLETIESCLGALGWSLVAVPLVDRLPQEAADALEVLGQHFASDLETYGFALRAAATWPDYARTLVVNPTHRRAA